jgi:hypothetical protein
MLFPQRVGRETKQGSCVIDVFMKRWVDPEIDKLTMTYWLVV